MSCGSGSNDRRAWAAFALACVLIVPAMAACGPTPEPPGPGRETATSRPRSTPTPTATMSPAEPLTMLQAFALLRGRTGLADIAFYAYEGFAVDARGTSDHYIVSGYSPAKKSFCYLAANQENGTKLECREQDRVDHAVAADVSVLKDSPELMAEAFAQYGPCERTVTLGVNPAQSEAELTCADAWSGAVPAYR